MAQCIKNFQIVDRIVFIDGLWGTGKSILGPVLSSFKKIEKQKVEYIFEYISVLHGLKKIENDAAIALMRLYADNILVNSMISREVNFRIFDDTGFLNNPDKMKYLLRLFYRDGDAAVNRIKKEKPMLQIMTHLMLRVIPLAFKSFGDNLRVVEMIRHPLYMLDHWFNYIERCGQDPRELTIWIEHNGHSLPYFSNDWADQFIAMNTMDKVIHSINWFTKQINETLEQLSNHEKKQILLIPFEKFVTEPWEYIKLLESFLDTKRSTSTNKVLKKQKCPRKLLTDGLGHAHYGWKKPDKSTSESDEYKRKMLFAEKNASKESLKILESLCKDYEEKWFSF